MATLFAIGAGKKDDVGREVDSHNGSDFWTGKLVERWSTTVEGR